MEGTAYNQKLASTGGTGTVTWSLSTGTLPAGLQLNTTTGAITGTPTGPASTTADTFTAKVTDSSSTPATATQQFSITVNNYAAPVITPASTTLPAGNQGAVYNQAFTVAGGNGPYTFAVTNGTLPTGLTPSTSGSTFIVAGTPTAACNACTFSVQVTDTSNPPQVVTNNFTLTVSAPSTACGSGNESMLSGQYAMLFTGFDNGQGAGETTAQPAVVGGVIYVDGGGHVTAGDFDYNFNGSGGAQELSVTGTYQIGADQRGCMSLTTTLGTENFRIAVGGVTSGVASSVHVVESDAAGPFVSGVMLQQDTTAFTTASINGNYTFLLSAPQNTASSNGGNQVAAGVLPFVTVDIQDATVSASQMDLNDEGLLNGSSSSTSWSGSTPLAINSGTLLINAFTGLGNLAFNVSEGAGSVNLAFQVYVVNTNEFLLLPGWDQTQTGGLFGAGVALKQSTTTFSSSSLNGISVLRDTSLTSNAPSAPTATGTIGTITTTSAGNFTLFGWENTGTAIQKENITGTTSVASNGRVTFSAGGGSSPAVMWLVGNNEGFYLGAGINAESGFFQPQTATTVTTSSPYAFGTVGADLIGANQMTGVATFTGSTVSGTTDTNANGTVSANILFGPLPYSVDSTGLGSIPSGCTLGGTGATGCQEIFYVVGPHKAVLMFLLNGQQQVAGPSTAVADQ
jgi:hypothetical protein